MNNHKITGLSFGFLATLSFVACVPKTDVEIEDLFPRSQTAAVRFFGSLQGEPKSMDYVAAWEGKMVLGSKRNDPVLNLYDLTTLQTIPSPFMRGNGPAEISYLGSFCADSQALFVYDPNVNKQLWLYAGAIDGRPSVRLMPGGDTAARYMTLVPLWNNRYVASGMLGHGDDQFCLLDSTGRVVDYLDVYPQSDETKNFPSYDKAFGFQGQILKTYDGKRFVYVSRSGLVLKFFGCEGADSIRKLGEYLVQIPKFTPRSNPKQQFYSVSGDLDNLRGVESLTADRKYYYLLFSGKKIRDDPSFEAIDQLLVFTHEGRPVSRIRLDRPVDRIAYDIATGKLYALAMDVEENRIGEIVLPELEPNVE